MWCEGSWEDAGECGRGKQDASCNATRHGRRKSKICRCQRQCVDNGPWDCHEEGCPARVITCDTLKVACRARFKDIWRKPPHGTKDLLVSQACPLVCGACVCERPDAPEPAKPPEFVKAVNVTGTADV